ncbi:hypothetical protein AB0N17_45810 [Streptomyces sp. NPDC051133]|uniref:hypothetical protein n=1 Tax=Streptomyces sp. NPDC051133 TaxID=3155521 RepID=UPI003446A309
MRVPTTTSLIPYVTQREGEEVVPETLLIHTSSGGQHLLYYADEGPQDRDRHGVLIARCASNPVDEHKMPTGRPQWKLMHPYRQMMTMQAMRCQVCARPAQTSLGFIFLAGPGDIDLHGTLVVTSQPPVCARHVRAAARLCPHLRETPMVLVTQDAPLFGVHGTHYGPDGLGVRVVTYPDEPLPYGHPDLSTLLASQLIRRLNSFRVVDLGDLERKLERAPSRQRHISAPV